MAQVRFASVCQCFPGCLTPLGQALQEAEADGISAALAITGWRFGQESATEGGDCAALGSRTRC